MIRRLFAALRTTSTLVGRPGTKLKAALLGVGAFLVICAADGQAKAGSVNCNISIVWFDDYSGGRLAIFCNGEFNMANAIIANVNETLCPGRNKSLDVIKVWTSMATAYQLAGRKIFMDFTDPAGSCNIKTINNLRSE